ncbi:hypothetical protein QN277_022894 [Acacia crassicarpa]|uniref:Uncharacterized protein n=1 Tax=Acacia crassicarpa TaxID=499986 RepID=A0AAE1MJ75_9FABA|nr:hypothetical protein QN277_022894 [Acacia crassicarpa]
MGAKSLKRRPIKQHNPEPQASMASSQRKIGSPRKVFVLLSASLTIAVIGLLAIWSYSRHSFESGVSYERWVVWSTNFLTTLMPSLRAFFMLKMIPC